MTESDREEPAQRLRLEPQVLANIPPSIGQRRTARIFILALLAILAITWPSPLQLPGLARSYLLLRSTICQACLTAFYFRSFSILPKWGY